VKKRAERAGPSTRKILRKSKIFAKK